MKKSLLIILSFLCFFCTKEKGCVEITLKEISNGKYYFYWGQREIFGIDDDGTNVPLSGSVTEEIFNQYKIGDIFCVD